MTMAVGRRHEVRGVLECTTGLFIGGWSPSVDADLAVTRDGLGLPVVPGTSLAGALRSWLADVADARGRSWLTSRQLDRLFGFIVSGGQGGSASLVRVDDAQLIGRAVEPAVRTSVSINRRTGAAATGLLFDREVLPSGTRFGFRLVVDEPPGPDGDLPPVEDVVTALVEGLTSGHVSLGAGRTRGLGGVRLLSVERRCEDLRSVSGLVAWLTRGALRPPKDAGEVVVPATPSQRPVLSDRALQIDISWRPVTPTFVKDSLQGVLVDTLPLTEVGGDGRTRLLLPGASIKGALRGHAERIVRTLLGTDAQANARARLVDERLVGVHAVFGSAGSSGRRKRSGGEGVGGWRGATVVHDCHSLESWAAEGWQAAVAAVPAAAAGAGPGQGLDAADRVRERASLRDRLESLNLAMALRVEDHVAIDRWTGGAAENRLFSSLTPHDVQWEPIRLRVDVPRLGRLADSAEQELAMALLLLVLRDLSDGWLSLGFGGTRGHGHVRVDEVSFSGAGLPAPWSALPRRTLADLLVDPPSGVRSVFETWGRRFPVGVAEEAAG